MAGRQGDAGPAVEPGPAGGEAANQGGQLDLSQDSQAVSSAHVYGNIVAIGGGQLASRCRATAGWRSR